RSEENVREIRIAVERFNGRGGKAVEVRRRECRGRVAVPGRRGVQPAEERLLRERGARERLTQDRRGGSRGQNAVTAAHLEHARQPRRGSRRIEGHVGE